MTEERRIQLVAEVDTTQTRTGFAEIGQQAGQMATAVERQGERAERAVSDIGTSATSAARNVESAQRSLIASIQRTTAQMEAGSRTNAQYYEVLARQRGVDPAVLTPYLNQLRAVQQVQTQTGASTAQVANAMRMVPAQLNDIAISLAGGQSPILVLMQQGSQLRDMFGSIPAAARGVGQSLLGLLNPYAVAAAAVGGLVYAYNDGAKEAEAYSRAIIMSGNAAGATKSQLQDLAQQVGQIKGSQGAAANALTQLVSTGKVSFDDLRDFTIVAIDAQRVLGQDVATTTAQFAELGKSPLQALAQLTDKYHSITSATYAQVKALQDQGNAAEAAKVAQQAYADATEQQKQKVLDSLTDWERGWLRIKDIVSKTVDRVLDLGRDASDQEKLNGLLNQRTAMEANLARAEQLHATTTTAQLKAQLEANAAQIAPIRARIDAQKAAAKAEADAAAVTEARNKWLDEGDKYLSRSTQLERELTKARNEGKAANLSQSEIDKRLADIRKSYADIFNDQIDARIAKLQRLDQVQDVLSQRELARIASEKTLGNISEADAINQTADAEVKAFDRKRKLIEDQIAETKKKANSDKAAAELQGQLEVLDEQRTNREKQRDNDIAALRDRRARESIALAQSGILAATAELNSLQAATEAQFQYNQEIGLNQVQIADLRAARLQNAASLKDESAAALEAIDPNSELAAKYREQAAALRDLGDALTRGGDRQQRYQQFKQAVDQYDQVFRQGFADMLNNGEAGWHSFTKSLVTTFKTTVADEIYKMFARPFVVQMVGAFTGMSPQVVAGEIAAGGSGLGGSAGGSSKDAISAAQMASTLYGALKSGGTFEQTITNGVQSMFDKMGLSMGGGSAGTAATWAGRLGGTASGFMAGSAINGMISGQYQTGSGFMKAEQVGTAIASYFGGTIGGAIAGAISGLINRAFGMGDTKVTSAGLRGTLSAMGVTGEQYTNYHQDGGWFRSDRNWADTPAFTGDQAKQFTEGFNAIEDAAAKTAKSLGASVDSLTDYTKTFDIALGSDQAANQKAITDFFTGLSDEIAKKLVPNLDDFTKSGETASAALQRLAGDFDATNTMAQILGKSAMAVFGSLGMDSATARERLVSLFGDTGVMGQLTSSYAQNYLSEAERLKPVQEALDAAMASLGLACVQTREQFKAVVDSLDLTTDAGAKEFVSLMKLADAFAQVHPEIQSTADAIQAMKDAAGGLLGDVDNAYSVLQKVAEREKTAIQKTVDAHQAAVDRLLGLSQTVHSAFDSYKTPEQKLFDRAAAQAEIRADLAIMKAGGVLSDMQTDSLKKALGNATQDASGQFGSYTDYLRDLYKTQIDIAALGDVTDNQLSVEQQALKSAQDQLKAIDDILASAQDQIDVLKGQSITLLSIDDAIRGLSQAILGAQSNPIIAATSAVNQAYRSALGRAPDAAGLQFWQKQAANGASIDDIKQAIAFSPEATIRGLYETMLGGRDPSAPEMNYWLGQVTKGVSLASITDAIANSDEAKHRMGIPGFVLGGDHSGGWRIVGEDGPELEATGPARIFNASQTASMLTRLSSAASDNREVVQRLDKLYDEMVPALQRIVSYTNRTAVSNEYLERSQRETDEAAA